jgi:hypothetical protein
LFHESCYNHWPNPMTPVSNREDRFWYFDALDARGGLAFASYRSADLGNVELGDDYTVHIGPPSFAPEQLSSRTVGHAAFRASFQSGLYAEGCEVAFPSLSSLIEFVRRGYLAGGGGDGANDSGSGVPPQPDEGPSDTPEIEQTFEEFGLTQELKRFSGESNSLKFDAGEPVSCVDFTWGSNQFNSFKRHVRSRSNGAPMRLFFALINLTIEVVSRFPGTQNSYLLSRWVGAASRLARAGSELLLWGKLRQYPAASKPLGIALAAVFGRWPKIFPEQRGFIVPLQRGYPGALEQVMHIMFGLWLPEWEFARRPLFWRPFDFWRVSLAVDAADDLACLPLPMVLQKSGLPIENLLELLTLFTGAPCRILELPEPAKTVAINLVIFSVSHLNREMDAIAPLDRRSAAALNQPSDHRATTAAQRGFDWLAAQMPRIAFPPAIESFIGDVADLKYRREQSTAL